jgi:hypothetical protein
MTAMAEAPAALGSAAMPAAAPRGVSADALARAVPVAASGAELGELFAYQIATPVTVGRGQSAMAPIVSARLDCRKELLYNGSKLASHPVATLRMPNSTGLTLERGPATVIDNGQYAGEAVLPLTAAEGRDRSRPTRWSWPSRCRKRARTSRQLHALRVSGHYLLIEEWDVRTRRYQLNNSSAQAITVLVEHPRSASYELAGTPAPQEQTAEHLRFAVQTPGRGEATLAVAERCLISRREEIRGQSAQSLHRLYLARGLLDAKTHSRLAGLLSLWEQIAAQERRLAQIEQERQKLYQSQEQARGNMGALGATGKEGELRASYVDKLRASEQQLDGLAGEEQKLQAEIARLKAEVEAALRLLIRPSLTP